jgi:F-type H+-transporting ATPase subunit b
VEDLLHKLGIEPSTLIIQAIGFIFLFLILKKYLFGAIGKAIEDRKQDFRDRMARLEADQKELDRLHEEVKRRLAEIELESRSRIQTAIDQGNAERERIIAQAREEAGRELEKARLAIQREKNLAIGELRSQVGSIAMQIAERVLNATLDATRHQRVINEFIEQLPSTREQ